MKKVLGWSAGILVLIAVISGVSSDTPSESEQAQLEAPGTSAVTEVDESIADETVPQVAAESTEYIEPEPAETVTLAPVAPAPAPKPKPSSNCDPNYTPCVPNVSYDLDCPDISFSVEVIGLDPHRFDRDGDGYGCEAN